jgi:hypothetical protein
MPADKVTVLLVGRTSGNAAGLFHYLKRHGCAVRSAASYRDAAGLLRNRNFDLVLGDFLISDGTAYRLMPLLSGTQTSLFISDTLDDGCWWMNAIDEGKDHTKEPRMHPWEFKARLDHMLVDKLRRRTEQALAAQIEIAPRGTQNLTFVRHLLVVLLACLTALGIFLFGVFAKTQPRSRPSLSSPTASQNRLSYQSKSEPRPTTPPSAAQRRFYETRKGTMT